MSLTTEQVQEYTDKGFVVVEGFFKPEEMTRISAWLDELRDKAPAPGEEAKYYERSQISDENILVRIENVIGDYNRNISNLLISNQAKEVLSQLLGETPVLFKEKINYKLPGCRADKLHQDQSPGWNAYCDFFVTMGIAVDEHRLDNGAISFMISNNYDKQLMTEEWQPLTYDDPPYQPEDEYALIECNPGDVIFFNSYVPHGSPPNTSTRSRRSIFLTFNRQSDGDMREQYYLDKWQKYGPNQADDARTEESFKV